MRNQIASMVSFRALGIIAVACMLLSPKPADALAITFDATATFAATYTATGIFDLAGVSLTDLFALPDTSVAQNLSAAESADFTISGGSFIDGSYLFTNDLVDAFSNGTTLLLFVTDGGAGTLQLAFTSSTGWRGCIETPGTCDSLSVYARRPNPLQGDLGWSTASSSFPATINMTVTDTPNNDIPEPSVLFLFGIGLCGVGFARRRKRA